MGEKIASMFQEWITDLLETTFNMLGNLIFDHDALSGFFSQLYGIFVAFGGVMLVTIALAKVLIFLLSEADGSREASAWGMIVDSFKASAMVLILPLILIFSLDMIVYPLGNWMFSSIGGMTIDKIHQFRKIEDVSQVAPNVISTLILLLFILIVFATFLIKICIYHADLVLLELLSVWAAISIINEEYNYMSVWWREFLSQIVSIIVQMGLMVGIVEVLSSTTFEWYSFMLLIGFGVLIIRGPSVLRSMWYGTGSGKATMQGSKMATRMYMMRAKSVTSAASAAK